MFKLRILTNTCASIDCRLLIGLTCGTVLNILPYNPFKPHFPALFNTFKVKDNVKNGKHDTMQDISTGNLCENIK